MQARPQDETDFGRFSVRYGPVLLAFFLRRVANRAEAEDLVQDALIRLAGSAERAVRNPNAYVFQVAANLLRDRQRRQRVRADYLAVASLDAQGSVESRDPARAFEAQATLTVVQAALGELPERTRTIFILYRMEQFDKRDIASIYRISRSAIDKHLMKAMAHIMRRTVDIR